VLVSRSASCHHACPQLFWLLLVKGGAAAAMAIKPAPRKDLASRIDATTGLQGLGIVFASLGIVTFEQLAQQTESNWQRALAFIPWKREDHPDDVRDPARYGPGHRNSLDMLRDEARRAYESQAGPSAEDALAHDATVGSQAKGFVQGEEVAASGRCGVAVLPTQEQLVQATGEAELQAIVLLSRAEAEISGASRAAARSLAHARQILAGHRHAAAEAAEALCCTSYAVSAFGPEASQHEALGAAERKCRDVLVWRCQLLVGVDAIRRRDAFLAALRVAVAEAKDAAAQARENYRGDFHAGRIGAVPFLELAAGENLEKKREIFESQALHAHRSEVSKRFPGCFLPSSQRTAARRGRRRKAKSAGHVVGTTGDAGESPTVGRYHLSDAPKCWCSWTTPWTSWWTPVVLPEVHPWQ